MISLSQTEAEHRVVVQQNLQMLGLRANLDKQTTQNNLNNMKLTRLSGKLKLRNEMKSNLISLIFQPTWIT